MPERADEGCFHIRTDWASPSSVGCAATFSLKGRSEAIARPEPATGEPIVANILRSGGIGKAMMDWIETEVRRLCCLMLKLETCAERTRARAFYKREGYAEPGIVMVKPLPAPGAMTVEDLMARGRR